MIYILIIIMTNGVATAEFNSFGACQSAADEIQQVRLVSTLCVSKG